MLQIAMLNKTITTCLLILLIIFFPVFSAFSQSHYYVDGKRIDLQVRKDKIAIVLNKTNFNESTIRNKINNYNSNGEVIKKLKDDLLILDFNKDVDESILNDKIAELSSMSDIVKLATKVYYGQSKKVTQIVTDEFVVKLKDLNDIQKLYDLNDVNGITILENINDENTFLLKAGDNINIDALHLSEIYYNTGYFEYCEPDFAFPDACIFNYVPDDTYYPSQWTLNNHGQPTGTEGNATGGDSVLSAGIYDADMDVDLAWDYVKGNSNVIVGIFDTGVDSAHVDLAQNLIAGYDATDGNHSVKVDRVGHGTCTSGIIGARTNNGIGVSGIVGGDNTPNSNCKIRMFNLVTVNGNFTTNTKIANAFNEARISGVGVVSNSWGGGTANSTLTYAINNLSNNGRGGLGCVVLFSSGNDGNDAPQYPAYLPSVVCVGASTRHDQKKAAGTGNQWWWGGNYGEDSNGDIDIVAPTICYTTDVSGTGGYNTASGTGGDYYATFNGTSAACPNAAGVAALILSVNPAFTRDQVIDFLYRGCEKIDNADYSTLKTYGYWNQYFGYGRVNAYNSVMLAMNNDITPPTIVHKNVDSHSSTYPTILTALIVDQDGTPVPAAGTQRPRIFYRFNKNNTGWTPFYNSYSISNIGNQFTFQIPGTGRQTEVQYYIEAEDASGNATTFPLHASSAYPYTLCYFGVGNITYESKTLSNWNPPDNAAQISSNVNFSESFPVLDTKVRINLTHNYVSDIMLLLWAPNNDANNNRVCLFSFNGGSGHNITNALVTDSASYFWKQGTPPYANGTFKPEYMLKGLNGTNAQGNWKFINMDAAASDAPSFSSLNIVLKKMNGVTSACARLNSSVDSVLYFGNPVSPVIVEKDFYLKNDGTANLDINSVSFTGEYSDMFSLISPLPAPVAPGDSALLKVRLNYNSLAKVSKVLGTSSVRNALMEISENDPSKPLFKVSLETDSPLPVELSSFTAGVTDNSVLLKWRTETEVNNYGFEIERSIGSTDKYNWQKIGFTSGSGTSNTPVEYSFADNTVTSGKYLYRLKQLDIEGGYNYSEAVQVELGIPDQYKLAQNYPNPFNPATVISFQMPAGAYLSLKVYDAIGNQAAVLYDGFHEAGNFKVTFDASRLSSGIYFCKMQAGDFTETKKMILLK